MRCEPSDTFSDVLAKTGMCGGGRSVSRILLCKNEKFVDPVHEVPLDAPLVLCEQYGQNVCYYLTEHEQMSTHTFSPILVLCVVCVHVHKNLEEVMSL